MLNLDHEYISYLVHHADFGDKFAYQRDSPIGPRVLTYDAFAHAMGLDTTHMTMTERQYTVDFHYQSTFWALCCPEHEQDVLERSRTNAVKLRTPWRILHTLLTRSLVPSLQSGHLMTIEGYLPSIP
ncbi:unnamed protein product [Linum trigynum]|uniref:Uncharacterized protein n=1 Tax=Linum trigynum TaxID=586398 RepID=A0AAV2FB24_9ROSI